ncbi:hypothetical protein ACLM5H_20175 [Fredinandcohnia humi]
MQLFLMEMKKIFSWKIITLIVFVNVVLYFLLIDFDIKHFPNGRPSLDIFRIEQQIIPKYGADIDDEEYADFVEEYKRKVEEANAYLQDDPQAAKVGITTYEGLRSIYHNEKQMDYRSLVMFEREEDLFWDLQAREYLMEEKYKNRITSLESERNRATMAQQDYFEELLRNQKYSFYTSTVLDNFMNIKGNMAIIIFISIAILVSPVYLRDKSTFIELLQYSSKKGRRVYKIKWVAGLVSAVLLTILLFVVYLSIYATNHTSSHFDLPLYAMDSYSWYELKFWQYIVMSVFSIFIVALILAILSMSISAVVANAIGLIGVQIVTIFIMIAGVISFLIKGMVSVRFPMWFVPLGYTLFFGVVLLLMFIVSKRDFRRDVM